MTARKHQLAMVMDLNKCLGCHTCTVACKTLWSNGEGMDYMWFNTVNTMPGRGTPRDWEAMGGGFDARGNARPSRLPRREEYGEAWKFNHDELYHGGKGDSSHLEINGGAPEWGPNWDEDEGAGKFPNSYHFYLPRICNHCTHAACQAACPRQAIEKRESDGIVTVNEDRCRGYRFCQSACPYKKIYFNHQKKVAQKCIFCFPRIDEGVAPACARQCPGRLRFVGYRDDQNAPIYKLVDKWKVALPLHPEYGTEPNVFYVPPIGPASYGADGDIDESRPRVPDEYLVSLFGPKVLDALATVKAERERKRITGKSELMDLLIAYEWKSMFGGLDRDPSTVSVIQWTKKR